ncbi:FAD-dependent oxidoreductase [Nibrella saemangeumensis]|uniref:FAD-dependent oxidoreductase n=1 Tax=Nibrella saemangeumensis TaxID=1084526 RepID=A0ABP8MYZ8_9BACT
MRHIVIVGNGIAGITAARHIRKQSEDRITVISSETDHFFSRTALMYIYMGHLEYHHTKPYEDWFWPKNRINLLRGYVEQVDFTAKKLVLSNRFVEEYSAQTRGEKNSRTSPWFRKVSADEMPQSVETLDNRELSYDVLVLAVGSRPNFYDWPGQDLKGVQGLYGMPDLERMEAGTKDIRQAVVVGGGLIGIEMCEMLLSRDIAVTFLVREESFWDSVLPPEESAVATRHIREHHVDLRLETELQELVDDGTGRVGAVLTTAGEWIPAQFVGIAVGVSPNIDFLRNTDLAVDRGILVNEYLETNLPDVYAIGDCVQHRSPPTGRKPIEQIWYTGRIMGETLAQTLLGKRTPYQPGVFFNSAKFFDIEYQTYGYVPTHVPDDGSRQTFYWEHPDGRKSLRINYRTDTGAVTGVNALGIRQRQEVWETWITGARDIRYVLAHLPHANFDPELFRQYEPAIVAKFNAGHQGQAVQIRAKKGLLGWLAARD